MVLYFFWWVPAVISKSNKDSSRRSEDND